MQWHDDSVGRRDPYRGPVRKHTNWSALFAGTDSGALLVAIATALGFSDAAPLDERTRDALGIPDGFGEARVAAGRGTTRALLLTAGEGLPLHDQLSRLATRLSARAPHLLWLAILASPRGEAAIATWSIHHGRPRVAALCVERSRILSSDIETLCAVQEASAGNDLLLHARWQELLGREALSSRFYRTLERLVHAMEVEATGDARTEDRQEIALLNVSRLLFLAFLESKGWLDADRGFLTNAFDTCMSAGGEFQRRVLVPLFFGTLNTRPARRAPAARAFGRIPFLNGGLFHRAPSETRARGLTIRDEEWACFYDELLGRYRFTAREMTGEWNEAAVDPEMLGRAFESLMVSRERRRSGAYYTPQALVERIADSALDAAFGSHGVEEGLRQRAARGAPLEGIEADRLREVLREVRVLDPACGSGAFLVHVLECLTNMRRASGDARPVHIIRRHVLTESMFGVDVNPTAVWLCELRLWLAVVIDHEVEDPLRVLPLPNLDHNIRCGDALAGGDFSVSASRIGATRLGRLRLRYARATGARKRTLGRALDRQERAETCRWHEARLAFLAAERRDLIVAARGRDLFGGRRGVLTGERDALRMLRTRSRELRAARRALAGGGAVPFAFAAHFPDVAAHGGFDVVVGNPPWVRLHRIPPETRARLHRDFLVYREAAWEAGARDARAGRGFAAQIDLAALFVERGLALTRPGGALALLIPAKLWRSLAGGGVRRLLQERHALYALEDWSETSGAFEAAVYPALVVARRRDQPHEVGDDGVRVTAHRNTMDVSWCATRESIPLDETRGAPWLVLPPDARAAFDRVGRGVPLVSSGVGHPMLGVKCGFNDAFLVTEAGGRGPVITVRSGERLGNIGAHLLRPLLRGEGVRPWRAEPSGACIVFPYRDDGTVLDVLPPDARSWLRPYRRALAQRVDARGTRAWWSLFRTEAARHDRPRVVWADVGRSPVALILPPGDRTVPLNTCYVLRCRDLEDAFTLAALLNSVLVGAWLGALAEPARGGYRRFMAWTVARLPVPDNWDRARRILAPLGRRAFEGGAPSRGELLDAVLAAYRIRLATVSPLLGWMTR
jgi:Eco57I restriction-modification methylase